MKVFVLTSGSYSDYHIVGIFSTQKKLKNYIKRNPDEDFNDLEEYEVDELCKPVKKRFTEKFQWFGRINLTTGEITQIYKSEKKIQVKRGVRSQPTCFTFESVFENVWHPAYSYVSEKHCRKLLVEKWQEFLRDYKVVEKSGNIMKVEKL